MPTDTAGAPDSALNATGSDIPNVGSNDIDAKINRAITNHMQRSEKRMLAMMESLEKTIAEKLNKADSPPGEPVQSDSNDASGEKRGKVRALEEKLEAQIKSLQTTVEQERKARQAAEERTIETRTRGEVESKLRAALGADNPHIPMLMDSLYDVQKRFTRGEDGSTQVRFKGQYGEEVLSLEEGIPRMVGGEFKHLVPAKASNLPTTAFPGLRGQPYQAPREGQHVNKIMQEFARGLSEDVSATRALNLAIDLPKK